MAVMLGPKTTVSASAPRNRAAVSRACAMSASVSTEAVNDPPEFAFRSRR